VHRRSRLFTLIRVWGKALIRGRISPAMFTLD